MNTRATIHAAIAPAMPAPTPEAIRAAADRAARAVPPLWPLASSVAVNPFLGQAGEPLPMTTARMRRVAGIALTMPRSWYAERIRVGAVTDADLADALQAAPADVRPKTLAALKRAMRSAPPNRNPAPTIADLAAIACGNDWPAIIAERLGHWAGGFFDQGQALWALPQDGNAWASWRAVATHELTPEIAGLKDFAATVAATPATAMEALSASVERLGLDQDAMESYFHRLLTTLGGWGQLARYRQWQAELEGRGDTTVIDLLAIRLVWESALFHQYAPLIGSEWQAEAASYAEPVVPTADDWLDVILQEALERSAQRRLKGALAGPSSTPRQERPLLQAAFCIDVRSEVFRRTLESVEPTIETLGFAGFFGLGVAHRRFASDSVEARLPVLLRPSLMSRSGDVMPASGGAEQDQRIAARARRAWGRFKLAAISSFAFVEATGPVYVGKLLRDGLGLARKPVRHDPAPRFEPALDLESRLGIAEGVLKAMSLTSGFARLVLLAGHGASVVNNPLASALNCGACGGFPGEVNARLLAALLNDDAVRGGLAARRIAIPPDTLFISALHDTTTDDVTIYEADHPSASHAEDIQQVKRWLAEAGKRARAERAERLPRASDPRSIARRARDWAELRPEWALAGCQALIAAPRHRTAGRDLGGRAFLHDYDWRRDDGFGVLELIMTAPVVVASWISLQYYGSTVAPDAFGSGNKLLHNVIAGVGVVEGNGGMLRGGLPLQSVHNGDTFVHEPLRLSVLVEAPRDAIVDVLRRHPELRALFDNRWLHLFALDDRGDMAWRYGGELNWESCENAAPATEPLVAVG